VRSICSHFLPPENVAEVLFLVPLFRVKTPGGVGVELRCLECMLGLAVLLFFTFLGIFV
jgi:hypothetical protein